MRLKGRVAIVTGAGGGIGRAIATRFAAEGARVVVADINGAAARETARAIAPVAGEALDLRIDVSKAADVRRMMKAAGKAFGPVTILVNNAAIQPRHDFLRVTEREWNRILAVNVTGPFLCSQAFARQVGRRGGVIINLASVNSVVAHAVMVPYSATKGAINMLTRGMAVALAPLRIRVVAIGPGTIATPGTTTYLSTAESVAKILSRTPIGRIGRPEEIAAVAAFLASDDASYLTGTTVYADGGRLSLNGVMPVAARAVRRQMRKA